MDLYLSLIRSNSLSFFHNFIVVRFGITPQILIQVTLNDDNYDDETLYGAYHIEKENPSFEAPTLDGAIQILNFPTLFSHFEHIATKELVRLGKH